MIVSPDNAKLKLIRKLRDRKWRERESTFVTEGEDLLAAGIAAGRSPRDVLVAAGAEIRFDAVEAVEVEPDLLSAVSALGSGTRVIAIWPKPDPGQGVDPVAYLHGIGDPGNVGTIIRTAVALRGGPVILGPGCADAYSHKAVRATMGAIFTAAPWEGDLGYAPEPRLALVAHDGAPIDAAISSLAGTPGSPTLCLGAERDGLPAAVVRECQAAATISLTGETESLNVAAAAAIGLQRISSLGPGGGG